MRFQPTVVFALGGDAAQIIEQFVVEMRELSLPSGETYPRFLYDAAAIVPQDLVTHEAVTCIPLNVKLDEDAETITAAHEDRKEAVSAFFRRALNRVNRRSDLIELQRTGGDHQIDQWIRCFIVAPICDSFGSVVLPELLQLLHSEYDREPPFVTSGILLLPGLYESEDSYNRQLFTARTFASLSLLDHAFRTPSDLGLRSDYLGRFWLVDSEDDSGKFVGYIEDLKRPVAEVLTHMVTTNVFEQGAIEGTRAYGAFGFSQIVFPRERLRTFLVEKLKEQFLSRHVLRKIPIDRSDLVLDTHQFIHRDLLPGEAIEKSLLDEICKDEHGGTLVRKPSYDVKEDLAADVFIREVEKRHQRFEDAEFPEVEKNLRQRSRSLVTKKLDAIVERLAHEVDQHPSGLHYAIALAYEILGHGEDCEFTKDRQVEPRSNLVTCIDKLKAGAMLLAGTDAVQTELEKLQQAIRTIEAKIDEFAEPSEEALVVADAAGDGAEESPEVEQPTETEDLEEEERQKTSIDALELLGVLKSQIETTQSERAALKARLSIYEEMWGGEEQKRRAFETVFSEHSVRIDRCKTRLHEAQQEQQSIARRLADLWGTNKRFARLLVLVGLPGIVFISLAALLPLVAMGLLSWSRLFGYFFLTILSTTGASLGVFLRRVHFPIRRLTRRQRENELTLLNLRTQLIKEYEEFFDIRLQLLLRDAAVSQLEMVTEKVDEIRIRLETSLRDAMDAREHIAGMEHAYPSTPFKTSIVSVLDTDYFFELCVPRIDNETAAFFSKGGPYGRTLSEYATSANGVFLMLSDIEALAQERVDPTLETIRLESLMLDDYAHLAEQVSPQRWAGSLRESLFPLVRLREAAKKRSDHYNILNIGVEDADSTRLKRLLEAERVAELHSSFFSHRDPDRVIAANVMVNFASSDLSRIGAYKKAFEESGLPMNEMVAAAIAHPKTGTQHLDERSKETRRDVLLAVSLSLIKQRDDQLFYNKHKVGDTLQECFDVLLEPGNEEVRQALREKVSGLVAVEDRGSRVKLQQRVRQYLKENADLLEEADRKLLEEEVDKLSPIL